MLDERPFFLKEYRWLYIAMFVLLLTQFAVSYHARQYRQLWLNIPPAPSEAAGLSRFLGDTQFAFRGYGMMLQNFGDIGGRTTSLRSYDYNRVGEWLNLLDKFDSTSRFPSYLASFYFGATQDPSKLLPVIEYLAKIGVRPGKDSWRSLVQAIYLARHRYKDLNLAQRLSQTLANLDNPSLPEWTKHNYLTIMSERGEKQAAAALILNQMRENAGHMSLTEFNLLKSILCDQTLTKSEADKLELCKEGD
jgi:hypothetical protein